MTKRIYRRKKTKNLNLINHNIIIHIKICLSNFIVTMTTENGNVFCWVSSGSLGFSGFHKNTPKALYEIVRFLEIKTKEFNIKKIIVKIKGYNSLKIELLQLLARSKMNIISFEDRSSFAFNGCRPQKIKKL